MEVSVDCLSILPAYNKATIQQTRYYGVTLPSDNIRIYKSLYAYFLSDAIKYLSLNTLLVTVPPLSTGVLPSYNKPAFREACYDRIELVGYCSSVDAKLPTNSAA